MIRLMMWVLMVLAVFSILNSGTKGVAFWMITRAVEVTSWAANAAVARLF